MTGRPHDRFCNQACPYKNNTAYRGECGGCKGDCDPSGGTRGHWTDCDCAPNACGDGHDCKQYIDITFELESFPIQGSVCCNSKPPLSEPCGGTIYTGKDPSILTPWTQLDMDGGFYGEAMYIATKHHVRLTRGLGSGWDTEGSNLCNCFWGGYWSGSCDCNKCCCSEAYPYSECPAEDVIVAGVTCDICCPTEPCNPDNNPCYPVNSGWASSLDDWGDGGGTEQGGSSEQAMCTSPTAEGSDCGCGYINAGACSGYVGHACWECGTFNPHHIEAYMAFDSGAGCVSSWQLEIKGLTEQARSVMGTSNLGLDCTPSNANACSDPAFGGLAEPAWGYIGRWWGQSSNCNTNCTDADSVAGVPELLSVGCSCPPDTEFTSSVRVTNTLAAFHPTTRYYDADPVSNPGAGGLMTCTIPHDDCGNATWLSFYPNTPYDGTDYYGKPLIWYCDCTYCNDCCDGDWLCGSCECGSAPDEWCDCTYPTTTHLDIHNKQYPCSHCTDSQENDSRCLTCEDSASRICAKVRIKIHPTDSPTPTWYGD